jgi:hypothetical protein
MTRLKLNAARIAALASMLLAGLGVSAALASPGAPNAGGPPSTVPGSPGDDCSHGNSDKDCKPDPQPGHGQECDDHGKASGNEDHCDGVTTTTTPSTTETTPSTTTSTPNDTTTSTVTTTTPTTQTGTTPPATTPETAPSPPAAAGSAPSSTSNPPVTKPELEAELAEQVKGAHVSRTTHARSDPSELPFTGFPAWMLALIGSLMLATGLGVRRLASGGSTS